MTTPNPDDPTRTDGRTPEVPPTTTDLLLREQRKRRKLQFALALAVGLLLLGAGAFAWWQDRQAQQHKLERIKADARSARAEAEVERQQRIAQERITLDRAVAAALLDRVEVALQTGDTIRAQAIHNQIEKLLVPGETDELFRRWEQSGQTLAFLQRLDQIEEQPRPIAPAPRER